MNFTMKTLFMLIVSLSTVPFAFADTCVSRASNTELLDEIRFRLGSGTGGGNIQGATASFSCVWNGDISVSLVNSQGLEQIKTVSALTSTRCQEVASLLNRTRAQISKTLIVAICTWTGDMIRYSLTPDGKIVDLSTVSQGTADKCIQQEKLINSRL